jgi:hypothetical protein
VIPSGYDLTIPALRDHFIPSRPQQQQLNMRLIGFGNSRPTLKVETVKSTTPQKNKQVMVMEADAQKLEVSHHPTKQGNPNTKSSASIVGGSASSPSPAPRKTIIKAAPKSPTTIRSSNSSVGSGTINTTTTNGSSGIGSINKNGHSNNNGFMKSTVASESRDISSPCRTGSEDNSTTSTDREVALDKLKASLGRFVRSGYVTTPLNALIPG